MRNHYGRIWYKVSISHLFFYRDYREQPELDVYSETGLDDASEVSEMSLAARRAAEREMAQRDQIFDDDAIFYEEGDDEEVSYFFSLSILCSLYVFCYLLWKFYGSLKLMR